MATPRGLKNPAQYMLVTHPDGGESWPADRTFNIRWRSQDTSSTVNIDLIRSSDQSLVASSRRRAELGPVFLARAGVIAWRQLSDPCHANR